MANIRTVFISLLVALSFFAIPVCAGTYSGGTGEPNNPYQIADANDWQELMTSSSDWNKHFIMTSDINLGGISLTSVGNDITRFAGVFDGKSHIIHNVVINLPDSNCISLFGFVASSGQIHNLAVENVNITGRYCIGGLVGVNSGLVTSCYSTGSVSGTGEVGGLVGSNGGSITSSYSTGFASGEWLVGGLVGRNFTYSLITSCYSTGAVSGTGTVGGLVGANTGSIISCYSTGSVNGTGDYVGGLVGNTDANFGGSIISCYSTGSVNGTGNYVGGLVGENSVPASITSCFWDIQTSGQTTSAGGTGKTTAEMHTLATFTDVGWDFVGESAKGLHDFWQIDVNEYPHFAVLDWTLSGDGTSDNPYIIESAADLATVWLQPYAYYRLNSNLDLSGISWSIAIIPEFTGVFDGQGFVVRDVVINKPGSDNVGIFGFVDSGGQIKNLGVENFNITGGLSVGGLVGANWGLITSCYVVGSISGTDHGVGGLVGNNGGSMTSCYSAGTVSGTYNVGGLVGDNGGSVTFCYSTSTVSGNAEFGDVGGLVGSNNGPVTSCYSTGTVSGTDYYVGGLVGDNYSGSIISCYSTGSVDGTADYVGGLAGVNYYGSITSSYSTGTVSGGWYDGGLAGVNYYGSITNSYSTSTVSGEWSVGGLVGRFDFGSLTSCFWDIQTSGQTTSAGGTGKTTAEMQTLVTFVDAGWGFVGETNGPDDIWVINEGADYPRHTWERVNLIGWYGVDFSDYAALASHWSENCPNECAACDIAKDGKIDMKDFAVIANHWMMTDCNSCGGADITHDGNVDYEDLQKFVLCWVEDKFDCNGADIDFSGVVDLDDLKILCDYWLEGVTP